MEDSKSGRQTVLILGATSSGSILFLNSAVFSLVLKMVIITYLGQKQKSA